MCEENSEVRYFWMCKISVHLLALTFIILDRLYSWYGLNWLTSKLKWNIRRWPQMFLCTFKFLVFLSKNSSIFLNFSVFLNFHLQLEFLEHASLSRRYLIGVPDYSLCIYFFSIISGQRGCWDTFFLYWYLFPSPYKSRIKNYSNLKVCFVFFSRS